MSIGGVPVGSAAGAAAPRRPRWVRPLTIVNFAFLGISAIVTVLLLMGNDIATAWMFFFPQIAMTVRAPVIGLIVIILTMLTCAVVAFTAKQPHERGTKFYTALTMCGFIINCLCLVAPVLVIALAQASF